MEAIGSYLIKLGLIILPYSFMVYFPMRYIEFKYNWGYSKLIKGIWYLALGLSYIINNLGLNILIIYICFIEAWDLIIQQKEINKD